MPYIEQAEPEPGCLFCNKARDHQDERDHIVYRGSRCFVMLNLYPYNSGHLMVAPYQHTGQLDQVDPAVGAEIFTTAQLAVRALTDAMHPDGFNVGINQGTVAGAGVADHIHLHIVPRWTGDTNFMPVLADAKVIPEMLTRTAAKLRPLFQRPTNA
jgi:ATP adenylyltransferase